MEGVGGGWGGVGCLDNLLQVSVIDLLPVYRLYVLLIYSRYSVHMARTPAHKHP